MLRIESHARFLNDAARRGEPATVNGVPFRALDGRVLSDPITERQVGMFDGVDGFALVRADPPYEMVKALTPAPPLFLTSADGQPATSEGDPNADATADAPPHGEPIEPNPTMVDAAIDGLPTEPPADADDGLDALTKTELGDRLAAVGRAVGARATKADMLAVLRGLTSEPE